MGLKVISQRKHRTSDFRNIPVDKRCGVGINLRSTTFHHLYQHLTKTKFGSKKDSPLEQFMLQNMQIKKWKK